MYFSCAWLYNAPIPKPNDETIKATARCDDEIIIVEKANGSAGNNREHKTNEGAAIKSTCETENVIIVHENHHRSSTSAVESFINNKLSVESETNLAIEMLDTVLEAEDEGDSTETEINSRRDSSQSINCKDVNVPVMMLARKLSDEKLPVNTPTETINLEIIDFEYIRSEIEAEIDEILKHAQTSVEGRLNEAQSDESDNDENVFKNRKFLTRLSNLISTKSSQQTSPRRTLNVQSKTLERKAETSPGLKHSKSAPDFKLILDSNDAKEKSFHDDTSVEYILSDDEGESIVEPQSSIPPPPIFSTELFERVATLKRREKLENNQEEEKVEKQNPIKDEDEDTESLEDESVNKENFRDKLEKLLSVPPTRLSLIAPIPLPRTSLIKQVDDEDERQPSLREITSTPAPFSASMLKQRELFDEVLRKIKRNDKDEKVSAE